MYTQKSFLFKNPCWIKRDFMLRLCNSEKVLHTFPLSLPWNSKHFFSSMTSANHDKMEGFQSIVKSLYPI